LAAKDISTLRAATIEFFLLIFTKKIICCGNICRKKRLDSEFGQNYVMGCAEQIYIDLFDGNLGGKSGGKRKRHHLNASNLLNLMVHPA